MTRLAVFLLLALSPLGVLAGLNTDGLPAGAAAVVVVDFVAFRSSQLGKAVEQSASLNTGNNPLNKPMVEKLNFDGNKDLREIDVAVYPGADGKVAAKNPTAAILLRGKFDPSRINTFGKDNQVPAKTVGKHQAWEAGALAEKLFGEKPKDQTSEAYLIAYSSELVLVASPDFLATALASLEANEKNPLLPAVTARQFAAVPKGWLFIYGDATKIKTADTNGATDFTLSLGESPADLQLALSANFVTTEKAAIIRKQLHGLKAFASIGLMNDEGKSPDEKENMKLLSELVQKLRIGGDGRTVTLDLDYAAAKAAPAIVKAIEKAKQSAPAPASK